MQKEIKKYPTLAQFVSETREKLGLSQTGLAKRYNIKESWSGRIVAYSGSAQCESNIVFSYSERDQDHKITADIKAGI